MVTAGLPEIVANCEEPAGRPIPDHPNALLFTAEAAFLMGLSPRTLEALRLSGNGPPFFAVTKRAIRYRRANLMEWIHNRKRQSTSDSGSGASSVPGRPAG